MTHPKTRHTLHVEKTVLIEKNTYPGQQFHLRLKAARIADHAKPGQFVHIQCDPSLLMRRPMSIMRCDPQQKIIDILFKLQGVGTRLLSNKNIGDVIDLIGPIGQPFQLGAYKKRPLLIGGGVGMPPMLFLAEHIKNTTRDAQPMVMIGSEIPFPFKYQPSKIIINEMPKGVIAAMPLLDDWGVPSRLSSLQNYAGCFNGHVTDLARHWLDRLDKDQLAQVEIFACGPTAMLKALTHLAEEYQLSCQVSLEEYMACAVGGCAGCTVLVDTQQGQAMQRVCVDGPVFDAKSVISLQGQP